MQKVSKISAYNKTLHKMYMYYCGKNATKEL